MRVDDRRRHRRSGFEFEPRCPRLGQAADDLSRRHDFARQFVTDEVSHPWIEGLEELRRRKPVGATPESLVARAAGVSDQRAGELTGGPVGGFDDAGRGLEDLRILVEDLQRLGHEPLRRGPAAVVVEKALAARRGDFINPVGLGLGRVVLPELDPGVRTPREFRTEAEGLTLRVDRQHRRRREVDADARDRVGGGSSLTPGFSHGGGQRGQVVRRMLECPVDAEGTAAGQLAVDHAVRIVRDRGCQLATGRHLDDDGPARRRAEVESDGAGWRGATHRHSAGMRITNETRRPGAERDRRRRRRRA